VTTDLIIRETPLLVRLDVSQQQNHTSTSDELIKYPRMVPCHMGINT
jgi:hypothetical protein